MLMPRTLQRVSRSAAGETVLAFAAGILLLVLFLAVAGFPVAPALTALWDGAFGSWYAFTSAVLVRATPLIILGLAFGLGAKGGTLNIGMEGQFAVGAIAATWAAVHAGSLPSVAAILVTLAAGTAGGTVWVAVPALLRARFGITEVISTLMLTFVGYAAVSYAVTGPLQEPSRTYPQSASIPANSMLPHLWPGTRLHAGFVIAALLALFCSILLTKTRWGLALRATGVAPRTAAIVGRLDTTGIAAISLLASGAMAGLGGAVDITGVSYALYQNLSPGYGYTAIAVALLGRLNPALIFYNGILFGALEAGAAAMQRDAGIPAVAVQVVEGVIVIVLLLAARRVK
jgi:general nucleoside transport system permease protein